MFLSFYHEVFYRPLFNGLVFLTSVVPWHDIGIAVIVLTILVRIAIFPFMHRSIKTQVKMRELEPELREIKEQFKDKKDEQARRTMELYKQHGVSPFSGCLMLLIQLPILIALYQVFWKGLDLAGPDLYSFIARPEFVRMEFLGLIDMATGSLLLALLAGLSQFIQMKLAHPPGLPSGSKKGKSFQDEFARAMKIQTTYVLPVFIAFISYRFPAAVALYWTTVNIFGTVHEGVVRMKAIQLRSLDKTRDKSGHVSSTSFRVGKKINGNKSTQSSERNNSNHS